MKNLLEIQYDFILEKLVVLYYAIGKYEVAAKMSFFLTRS